MGFETVCPEKDKQTAFYSALQKNHFADDMNDHLGNGRLVSGVLNAKMPLPGVEFKICPLKSALEETYF